MNYSIVNYSSLEGICIRLDPEYYHPLNLELYSKLSTLQHSMIGEFAYVTDGIHESIRFDENGNINLISARAPKENYFNLTGCGKIDPVQDSANPRTRLKENDIILTTVGTIGNCAVVDDSILPANSDRHVGIIRINKDYKPLFISTFLLTKYGKFQTLRESTGNVQLNLFIYKIKEIIVPKLSDSFQGLIENVCIQARQNKNKAEELYDEAERITLKEIRLIDWKPKHELSFIRSFSDVKSADRIDAEYFQTMYDELLEKVTQYKNGFQTLDDIVSIRKCIEPGSEAYEEKGIPFLRVSNLSKFGINNDNQQYISGELYEKLKAYQPIKGEILLSKDATPGIAYYLNNEPGKMIPSGGILRLKVKNVKTIYPEYLTLVLNSVVVQKQIERDIGGSVINHWLVDKVKETLIPILPEAVQREISDIIADSFAKREQSKKLLDIAKCGVEMAIEKSEEEAKKWLNEEVNHAGSSIHLESR